MSRAPRLIPLAVLVLLLTQPGCRREVDPNRITIWHQMRVDERLILEQQLARYMAERPGITVEQIFKETEELRSGFIVAAIAGQGPDLIYGPADQIGPFEVMRIIRPLEDLFSQAYLDSLIPEATRPYNGHLYQLADKLGNHLTLVYNRDLISTPPETDLDLIRLGQELTTDDNGDGKPDRYALAWNYTEPFFFIPFLTGFGGWVMTDDGVPTLDSPGTVEALKFIRDLRDRHRVIPAEADYNVADALFKDGKSAMIINGDWSWAGYRKAGVNIGVAPLPKITSTGLWCAPMVAPRGYSINVNVKNEKLPALVELLTFLMRSDIQLETTEALWTMPTRRDVVESEFVRTDAVLRNSALQIERGRLMPMVPELRAVWDAMRPSYQGVLGGSMTPEAAARAMQELAVRKIKEMNE